MRPFSAALMAAILVAPAVWPAAAQAQYRSNEGFRGNNDGFRGAGRRDFREHDWRAREYRDHRAYYAPPGAYYGPRPYRAPPLFGITIR